MGDIKIVIDCSVDVDGISYFEVENTSKILTNFLNVVLRVI